MPDPDPPAGPDEPLETGPEPSAEQRLAEVVAAYRALQAENEAYRERVSRNAERRFAQRHERLLLRFIDILDNLDRALEAAELTSAGGSLIEGLILVRTQLLQTLQEEGLERIPVVGLAYDPEVAEAVGTKLVSDPDHHHLVVKDVRRGYRLNGKLARAAQVLVGEFVDETAEHSVGAGGEVPVLKEEPSETSRAAAQEDAEDSGRVEVVESDLDAIEDADGLEALAAQAAAAVADDAESADAGGGDEDGDELVDDDSLEQAAREAAALVGDEADPEADPEPESSAAEPEADAGERTPGARLKPRHPLDDVDPSAFDELEELEELEELQQLEEPEEPEEPEK